MKAEEQEARRVLLREALVHLDRSRSKNRDQSAMHGQLIADYQQRLDAMPAEREKRVQGLVDQARRSDAILEVLQAERVALIRLWDEGQIDDEVLRTLQRELDLEESRVHTRFDCSALESTQRKPFSRCSSSGASNSSQPSLARVTISMEGRFRAFGCRTCCLSAVSFLINQLFER